LHKLENGERTTKKPEIVEFAAAGRETPVTRLLGGLLQDSSVRFAGRREL
jgi:hypothetical protein